MHKAIELQQMVEMHLPQEILQMQVVTLALPLAYAHVRPASVRLQKALEMPTLALLANMHIHRVIILLLLPELHMLRAHVLRLPITIAMPQVDGQKPAEHSNL